MSKDTVGQAAHLPATIPLFRFAPERRAFDWKGWNAASVRGWRDLPPYLALGSLDASTFTRAVNGWSARWQGSVHDTWLDLRYDARRSWLEIHSSWCGIDGDFGCYEPDVPLERLLHETLGLRFPPTWERAAKEHLEREYQITYVESAASAGRVCFVPDGSFLTVAVPVAVANLRHMRDWLHAYTHDGTRRAGVVYPIAAEAFPVWHTTQHLIGKAPDWTACPPVLYKHAMVDAGTVPAGWPEEVRAPDGSLSLSLQRHAYLVLVRLPFAGLTDFLRHSVHPRSPFRRRTDPELRIELQPLILPVGIEYQGARLSLWDRQRTTYCSWKFPSQSRTDTASDLTDFIRREARADELLNTAERQSAESCSKAAARIDSLINSMK